MTINYLRSVDGFVRPDSGEVGVYWPDEDLTNIYSQRCFIESEFHTEVCEIVWPE